MAQSAFEERSWRFCSYPFGRRRDGLLTYIGRRHEDCWRRSTGDGVPSGEYAGFHGRIAQCATPVLRMGLRQVGLGNELCFGPVNGDTVWLVLTLLGGATLRRQVHRHPSLNAGIPEARMAGVLGVRLGGRDFCGGVSLLRAELGESTRPLNAEGIVRAVGVVRWCGVLVVLAALALR